MKTALFDAGPKAERWRGSKALVLVGLASCPSCSGQLDHERIEEDALLRHGGHGATRVSVRAHCSCGFSLLVEQSEARPPRA